MRKKKRRKEKMNIFIKTSFKHEIEAFVTALKQHKLHQLFKGPVEAFLWKSAA
jgi:hypothetical protein